MQLSVLYTLDNMEYELLRMTRQDFCEIKYVRIIRNVIRRKRMSFGTKAVLCKTSNKERFRN